MATTVQSQRSHVPWYVPLANKAIMALARAGFKLRGPGIFFGNYPMYLLTVRGRKSGLPRTVPVAIIQHKGRRYVGAAFEMVDWARNLRAAGEATLTRGRRSETVSARELPPSEAALVLRDDVIAGNPFAANYGVTASSSLAEFEQATRIHPLFILEPK